MKLNIFEINHPADQELDQLIRVIKRSLNDPGYVLIRGLVFDLQKTKKFFLELGNLLGKPLPHDSLGTILWDVRDRQIPNSIQTTFSENSSEAILHTDSQFRDEPENIIGLFCIEPAACGGGESMILSLKDIKKEIHSRKDGLELTRALKRKEFVFPTPNAFKMNPTGPTEFIESAIFDGEKTIRYRKDTMLDAITKNMLNCRELIDAFTSISSIIENSKATLRFGLKTGDLLMVNNRNTLHGRTEFNDKNRHLLRLKIKTEMDYFNLND